MSVLSSVVVAFAAAPEGVAFAAEFVRDFHRLLHLRRGKGEDIGIAARRRAVHVARMRKQIRRAPKQFDAGALLFFLQHFGDGVEILVGFGEGFAFRRNVAVVKAVKRRAELFDEFEGRAHAVLRVLDGFRAVVPGADHRARAERIAARAAERVPVDHGEAQVVAHGFALDDFVGVVMFEGERVFGFRAFVFDFLTSGNAFFI